MLNYVKNFFRKKFRAILHYLKPISVFSNSKKKDVSHSGFESTEFLTEMDWKHDCFNSIFPRVLDGATYFDRLSEDISFDIDKRKKIVAKDS